MKSDPFWWCDLGKKNKKGQRLSGRNREAPGIRFSTLSVSPDDHPAFRRAARKAATTAVKEFPRTIELVQEQFRRYDPLLIMATWAMYSSVVLADASDSRDSESVWSNIHQHHTELLQAVLLSVPEEKWGQLPFASTQVLFDNVPKLSDTFLHQRLLEALGTKDQETAEILSLQMRVRFHTQLVRNWGYLPDMIRLAGEMYSPLDTRAVAFHGFSISDLIDVTQSLMNTLGHLVNEHFKLLQRVWLCKHAKEVINLYCHSVLDLEGSPEEVIAAFPPGIGREDAIAIVTNEMNISQAEHAICDVDQVAADTGRVPGTVEKILRAISLPPGELISTNPDHLFLDNPVWTAPGIDLGNRFFLAMPQVVFSHIHPIVSRLCKQAGLDKELAAVRARFLEKKLGETLERALPCAKISSNVRWQWGGREFETDQLVILDRMVVIAEAKSHHLTPAGLRGAPARVKKHIQELVLAPSIQSDRLRRLILGAKSGDQGAAKKVRKLGINPPKIDRVIRLSVSLDDLSVIWSAEEKIKEIGWVPADHELAPVVSIADLICLVDILDNPILFLHYLHERGHIQKSIQMDGDEMDVLGLYLETGFNIAQLEKEHKRLGVTGLSDPMDQYYAARYAGESVPKPKVMFCPLFRAIIDRLCHTRPAGWSVVGLHLLNCADYSEQVRLEKKLEKLRRSVRKNYRNPSHINSVVCVSPKNRKAALVFYLYPEDLRPTRRTVMQQLGAQVLADTQCEEFCVIGKNIDKWDSPYEIICVGRQGDSSKT